MLISQLLHDIAVDLNDAEEGFEHATWSEGQLLVYLNEAQCHTFTLRPNAFTQTVVMKLRPGSEQEPCDCTILHKIVGQTDSKGNLLGGHLPRRSDPATYGWSKPGCPPPRGPFRLTGYNFDPLENGLFSVTPPVPPGQDVYVTMRCATMPEPLTLESDTDDCRFVSAAKQWVLFRALMVDQQSANSVQAALVHLKLFFSLIGLQFTKALAQQIGALPSAAQAAPQVSV